MINRRDALAIGIAALTLTILNAWKPVVVDDTAYLKVAEQISHHPGDPYGFDLFWRDVPEPANHVLAPPVLPYWIAADMTLFGENPVLWKLGLLPFALVLAYSVHRLSIRLAPGRERLVLLIVVSFPGVLAGFNLMTDVPALALGLLALSIALAAIERQGIGAALLAGLIAGVAMQTKYTAAAPLAVAALYGLFLGRPKIVACILVVAGFVFVGWESFVLLRYGESHLSIALTAPTTGVQRSLGATALGLLCLIGGTGSAVGLLGLVGLRARLGVVLGASFLVLLGVLAIALLPAPPNTDAYLAGGPQLIGPEIFPFGLIGLFVVVTLGAVTWTTLRSAPEAAGDSDQRSLDLLVVSWLLVELALVFFLAPFRFLAARRLLGLIVAATFLSARASRSRNGEDSQRGRSRVVACLAVLIGLFFYFADFSDALARRDAVTKSTAKLAALGANPTLETVWFTGHWGFQFYAERQGFQPVVPGESHLEQGDWLLMPVGLSRQRVSLLQRENLEALAKIDVVSRWPWSTIPGAYIGMLPLRRQPRTQVIVGIFRVERAFTALGSDPADLGKAEAAPSASEGIYSR